MVFFVVALLINYAKFLYRVYTDFGVRLLYLYSVYVTIGPRRTRKTALKGRNRTSTGFILILKYVFYTYTGYM